MTREELREKISNISNSCFPLIDFFNDIGRNKESRYDKEKAYEDIEKIYDVFMFYKEKCEKLEKDLRQTKLNFKNSQTHSRTHYKKLLDRYMSLEKQNQELLVNKNVAQGIAKKFKEENDKLKKAVDKACEKLDYTCPVEEELIEDLDCDNNCKECWKKYFMKEVLGND